MQGFIVHIDLMMLFVKRHYYFHHPESYCNRRFFYIKYFSPWLDLLILFRTVKTMLTGWGAR